MQARRYAPLFCSRCLFLADCCPKRTNGEWQQRVNSGQSGREPRTSAKYGEQTSKVFGAIGGKRPNAYYHSVASLLRQLELHGLTRLLLFHYGLKKYLLPVGYITYS